MTLHYSRIQQTKLHSSVFSCGFCYVIQVFLSDQLILRYHYQNVLSTPTIAQAVNYEAFQQNTVARANEAKVETVYSK
jgi:hypothetical protein